MQLTKNQCIFVDRLANHIAVQARADIGGFTIVDKKSGLPIDEHLNAFLVGTLAMALYEMNEEDAQQEKPAP